MAKYIFITGGVVSSLGKGIAAASLGSLLEAYGIKVTFLKMDPYINIDPGTMSPYQHGEVYVTDDGIETDLDLGHYERFSHVKMSKKNYFTCGKVYAEVTRKERKGEYLGATIQVVPHITNQIEDWIVQAAGDSEVALVEVGGTIGDIESLPFLEAIRQMRIKHGSENTMYIHLTLVPYIATSGEMKTKPTQHSVKDLRSIGIQPDLLWCRSEEPLTQSQKDKIALFTNVEKDKVASLQDVKCIYQIPLNLEKLKIGEMVADSLSLDYKKTDMNDWVEVVNHYLNPTAQVTIGMVGKYTNLTDSYKSINEALIHAGIHYSTQVDIMYINSEEVDKIEEGLKLCDAVLVPGGFGHRGVEGMILAAKYARTHKLPYLGICMGMQIAVIEFAQNVLELDANSSEFAPDCEHKVIGVIDEWQNGMDLGGTMRLGLKRTVLADNSFTKEIYKSDSIKERHRHRYEFNPNYQKQFEENGLKITGVSEEGLVDVVENVDHPWFVGCQYHPEFLSSPRKPHPLFKSFINQTLKDK